MSEKDVQMIGKFLREFPDLKSYNPIQHPQEVQKEYDIEVAKFKEHIDKLKMRRYGTMAKCFIDNLKDCIVGSPFISPKLISMELPSVNPHALAITPIKVKYHFDKYIVAFQLSSNIDEVRKSLDSSVNQNILLDAINTKRIIEECTKFIKHCEDSNFSYYRMISYGILVYQLYDYRAKHYTRVSSCKKFYQYPNMNEEVFHRLLKTNATLCEEFYPTKNNPISDVEVAIVRYLETFAKLITAHIGRRFITHFEVRGNIITYKIYRRKTPDLVCRIPIDISCETKSTLDKKLNILQKITSNPIAPLRKHANVFLNDCFKGHQCSLEEISANVKRKSAESIIYTRQLNQAIAKILLERSPINE